MAIEDISISLQRHPLQGLDQRVLQLSCPVADESRCSITRAATLRLCLCRCMMTWCLQRKSRVTRQRRSMAVTTLMRRGIARMNTRTS